ncbi:AbrB family transcriptional regulator [Paenibacillus campi]|uniref:AbrB family transcriptional regulator n=1 Tax=Paenibacillus campi TaxID=3106031 RepID=UPI002AFF05F4|nr:AbrB family transcriptional regulator [Paenibacillus sp. SGZ-1014]
MTISSQLPGQAVVLLSGLSGGLLFYVLHLPVPWLLGPMIAVFIGTRLLRRLRPSWPAVAKNIGIMIVGYSIGLSLTMATLSRIGQQLPSMITLTVLLLLFCGGLAYMLSRWTGIPFQTMLIASIPGGLSQIVVLAEEQEGIDITIVTFLQVSRLMMIVIVVPLLVFSPLFATEVSALTEPLTRSAGSWSALFPSIVPFLILCPAAALFGKKINFPTAYLLLPMIVTCGLQLVGLHAPALPLSVLDVAQLLIGSSVGLMLHPEQLQHKLRIVLLALGSGLILMLFACGTTLILMKWHDLSAATALLSMAPGGMDQMSLIAHEVNADVATVSCYQLFRTLLIFLIVPPLVRAILGRWQHKPEHRSPKY